MQATRGIQRRALTASTLALLFSQAFARAPEPGKRSAPPEVAQLLPQAEHLGSASLRFLGFPVYHAHLYVPVGFLVDAYFTHPFALELHYLRSLQGEAIAHRSIEEMRRLDSLSDADAQTWLHGMKRAFPNVADGDRLTGIYQPTTAPHTRFFANGKASGQIEGARFARLFFGIWLAPNTSQPELRRRLIGRPE